MIVRILNFDKRDWKHIGWLLGKIMRGYWKGDWRQMAEAWFWVCFHFDHDSHGINQNGGSK